MGEPRFTTAHWCIHAVSPLRYCRPVAQRLRAHGRASLHDGARLVYSRPALPCGITDRLRSAFAHMGEPRFTTAHGGFQGTVDFIFYDARRLAPHSHLRMPSWAELAPERCLPSARRPSDHLPIACELELLNTPTPNAGQGVKGLTPNPNTQTPDLELLNTRTTNAHSHTQTPDHTRTANAHSHSQTPDLSSGENTLVMSTTPKPEGGVGAAGGGGAACAGSSSCGGGEADPGVLCGASGGGEAAGAGSSLCGGSGGPSGGRGWGGKGGKGGSGGGGRGGKGGRGGGGKGGRDGRRGRGGKGAGVGSLTSPFQTLVVDEVVL